MTPQERAKIAVEDWEEGTTAGHPSKGSSIWELPGVIAKHIKDAENDALERAAIALEGDLEQEDQDEEVDRISERQYLCGVIRALKRQVGDLQVLQESTGPAIIGQRTIGGVVHVPAAGINANKSYAFKVEHQGKTYTWTGVFPTIEADEALFDLLDQEIKS